VGTGGFLSILHSAFNHYSYYYATSFQCHVCNCPTDSIPTVGGSSRHIVLPEHNHHARYHPLGIKGERCLDRCRKEIQSHPKERLKCQGGKMAQGKAHNRSAKSGSPPYSTQSHGRPTCFNVTQLPLGAQPLSLLTQEATTHPPCADPPLVLCIEPTTGVAVFGKAPSP
jgi:hypothetical protein